MKIISPLVLKLLQWHNAQTVSNRCTPSTILSHWQSYCSHMRSKCKRFRCSPGSSQMNTSCHAPSFGIFKLDILKHWYTGQPLKPCHVRSSSLTCAAVKAASGLHFWCCSHICDSLCSAHVTHGMHGSSALECPAAPWTRPFCCMLKVLQDEHSSNAGGHLGHGRSVYSNALGLAEVCCLDTGSL